MNRPSPSDDGLTVIRTGPATGPASDFAPSSTLWSDSLPEGLRLGEYEIRSVIGEGGFGIVYLAYDHFLQRQVALKEYMPSTLAGRARTGLDVVVKAERHRETFLAGLRSFVNEARLLAQFDHPALVKVYRFWEAHGTAYMVMPYCIGPTLKEALVSHDDPPDEAWLRDHLLGPLLEALALLHKAQCLHRDIAPDNILLTDTGPLLLDFGAARQIIGDMSQTLTVVLKPGYAPIEQYGEVASMGQGAWTDLYALGGVVRYAITGKVPVAATSRIMQDTLVPLADSVAGQYSDTFLRTVDAALSVKPADRPQDVAAFQALLDGQVPAPLAAPAAADEVKPPVLGKPALPLARTCVPSGPDTVPKTIKPTEAAPRTGPRSWSPVPAPAPGLGQPRTGGQPLSAQPKVPAAEVAGGAQAMPSRQGAVSWLAGFVLLAALAAGGWWFLNGPGVSAPGRNPAAALPAVIEPAAPASAAIAVSPAEVLPVASAPRPAATATSTPVPRDLASPSPSPMPPAAALPTPVVTTTPPRVATTARAEQAALPAEATPKSGSPATDRSARCSDILQKASLEPLSASEAAFLKSECR